jgi:mycothiol synthase
MQSPNSIRSFRWDDLPQIVAVMNRCAQAFGRAGNITVEQIEPAWRSPYNHPEQTCFVAEAPDGGLIGFTIADLLDDPTRAVGVYNVPPEFGDIGRALIVTAADCFTRAAAQRVDAGTPLSMEWRISDQDTTAMALLEGLGYQRVRAFYTMRIALDMLEAPIEAVPLPDGFTVRPFTPDQLESVYTAKADAFLDHWGEDNTTLDEWHADIQQPGFDPSLWWIAYAGDNDQGEIAGMVLSRMAGAAQGWVDIVGVRRGWRKRGLAYALLRRCFAEFQRRGVESVLLGVDTDSSTNAVALYQRAGMHVQARQLYYQQNFTADARSDDAVAPTRTETP